jgi:hypothetical protein
MADLVVFISYFRLMKLYLLFILAMATPAVAVVQSSANYTVLSATTDGGGLRASSANYSNVGSVSEFGGLVTASAPQETDRTGYAGQLYEVTAFTLTATSTNLNEAASMPLNAVQFLDDGTVSAASSFAQWLFTGPIVSVNAAGIITAADVSQSTPAWVGASLEGWSSSLNLTVIFMGILPGYNQITGQLLSDGNMRLSFIGTNGINYSLDRCYNLSPPVNWVPQWTNPAGVNGMLVFTNLANPTTNNFWRIRSVP